MRHESYPTTHCLAPGQWRPEAGCRNRAESIRPCHRMPPEPCRICSLKPSGCHGCAPSSRSATSNTTCPTFPTCLLPLRYTLNRAYFTYPRSSAIASVHAKNRSRRLSAPRGERDSGGLAKGLTDFGLEWATLFAEVRTRAIVSLLPCGDGGWSARIVLRVDKGRKMEKERRKLGSPGSARLWAEP